MLPTLISVVIFGMAIVFHGVLLKYIMELEKKPGCECSKAWNREFIKYYLVASLVVLGFNVLRILLGLKNNALTLTVSTVMQILGLLNLFVMFFYTQKLKNTECACSDDWRRTFMNVYSFSMLAFFPIVTLILLMFVLLSGKSVMSK